MIDPPPLVLGSDARGRLWTALGLLGLGGALLGLAVAIADPVPRQAGGALGAGLLLGGVALLALAPWRRVSIDPATRRIVIEEGTRFGRKRRVLPFTAVLRLEIDEIGDEETGYRRAVRAVLRDEETVALSEYTRSRDQAVLDRQNIERVLT